MISAGQYPLTTLRKARDKQLEYIDLLDQGINPSAHKKELLAEAKAEKSFKDVAYEWHSKKYQGKSDRYSKLVIARLENHAFPTIGHLPIQSIDAPMMFNMIEAIQDKGNIVTGKRVNGICSMVFRYCVVKGYASRDVTQSFQITHPAILELDVMARKMLIKRSSL